MTTQEFETAYKRLNTAQKEAVDTIEGPVMVIAGPGTGKTQILTLRVANILLKTDTPPEAILALTFTEAGAHAMRERLRRIMGSRAYRVQIHTFHGFANSIIAERPESFARIIGSVAASEAERVRIMTRVIEAHADPILRPHGDPEYYVRPALGAISDLKRDAITPDRLENLIAEQEKEFRARGDLYHEKGAHKGKMKGEHQETLKRIEKNKALLVLYRAYEMELRTAKLIDFDDMILEVIRVMTEDDDVRLQIQERCQYVLADEHQDANDAQNKILELVTEHFDSPNLFIVGDEKQAIFRFQGASLANFLYFKKKYPEAKEIRLTENYRSTQEILDPAHSLIMKAAGDASLRVPLNAANGAGVKISARSYATELEESHGVAVKIRALIETGTEPSEIAVLCRTHGGVGHIREACEREGIAVVVEGERNTLHDPAIASFVSLIEAVSAMGDDEKLACAMHGAFLGFDPLDVYKAIDGARKERVSLAEVLPKFEQFREFSKNIKKWSVNGANSDVPTALQTIARESGFVDWAIDHEKALTLLSKLSSLFDEAESLARTHRDARLSDFAAHLGVMREHGITIAAGTSPAGIGGVRVMTAHKSKGLEFEHVFVTGLYDGNFGNRRTHSSFVLPGVTKAQESDDDERRLLYVAITRGKKSVELSWPRMREGGRETLPSRFLDEIDERMVLKTDEPAADVAVQIHLRTAAKSDMLPREVDKEFLSALFLEQGLSVTALNNYLRCPWEYFYKNLVRIPQAQTESAAYGTAVHSAMNSFFRALNEGNDIGVEGFMNEFERALFRSTLTEENIERIRARGRKTLPNYFSARRDGWRAGARTEFDVSGVEVGGVLLRGRLDRIDTRADGGVDVFDYKTSKPKSRNDIMGATKSSDGDYFRQLVFYKVLLDGYDDGVMKMRSGVIEFIEPDDRGNFRAEKFEITDADTTQLAQEIARVVEEIRTLGFWNRTCDDTACEYCALHFSA